MSATSPFAIVAVVVASATVAAQQPPAPSASSASAPRVYTRADVTLETPCGAPGVGEVWGGTRKGQVEYRDGRPRQRVNGDGYWEAGCTPPAPPPPPKSCSGDRQPATWTADGHTCTSRLARSSDLSSPSRRRSLAHGESQMLRQTVGPMRGMLLELCRDGERVQQLARCAPATGCDTRITAYRGPRIDGKQVAYSYDARGSATYVPNGSTVLLQSTDGRTWPASCVAGDWVVPHDLPRGPRASAPSR